MLRKYWIYILESLLIIFDISVIVLYSFLLLYVAKSIGNIPPEQLDRILYVCAPLSIILPMGIFGYLLCSSGYVHDYYETAYYNAVRMIAFFGFLISLIYLGIMPRPVADTQRMLYDYIQSADLENIPTSKSTKSINDCKKVFSDVYNKSENVLGYGLKYINDDLPKRIRAYSPEKLKYVIVIKDVNPETITNTNYRVIKKHFGTEDLGPVRTRIVDWDVSVIDIKTREELLRTVFHTKDHYRYAARKELVSLQPVSSREIFEWLNCPDCCQTP